MRVVLLPLVAILLLAPGASAQVVGNPTNALGATIDSASLVAGKQQQMKTTLQGPLELLHDAKITANGVITVPMANFDHVMFKLPDQSGTSGPCSYQITKASFTVIPTADATGLLNPSSGQAAVNLSFYLQGTYTMNYSCYGFPGTPSTPQACQVGSPDSPLQLQLTTGTTSPPSGSPNPPITGTPYSQKTGELKLVDNTFALPASTGCDPLPGGQTLNGYFDQQIGLPSDPGHNTLIIKGHLNPVILAPVQAVLDATPQSGKAPLTVHLDASSSRVPGGARSYVFRFGDGSAPVKGTSPKVAHTYKRAGRYTAAVIITGRDGDTDRGTVQIVVRKAG